MADDDVIGVCTECKSDQNSAKLERNAFYLAGLPITCQYCGGVVVLCEIRDRESVLRQIDTQRQIGQG